MAIAITAASGSVLTRSSAITMQGPMTISAWVFLTTAPGSGSAIYACYMSDTSAVNSPNILLTYDGGFECRVNVGGTQLLAGGAAATAGKWYHICGVVEGTSSTFTAASVYQDGNLLQRVTGSISVPTAVSPSTFIGNQLSGGGFGTQNDPIAEIAIWNTQLTANQIFGLAAGIPPTNFAKSNLVSWVSLNQTSGTITDHIAGSWTISSSTGITTSTDPPIPSGLPSDIVQATNIASFSTAQTTVATTFSNAQTAGNTNAAFVIYLAPGAVTATASDTANGSYTAVGPIVTTAANIAAYIFYKTNIAAASAGSNTLTVTFSGAINFPEAFAVEVSGVKNASFDVSATAKTTTQAGNGSIAITTLNSADKILTALYQNGGLGWTAAGSGFSMMGNYVHNGFIYDFQKVASAATYTDTPTNNGTNSEWIALALALQTLPVGGGPLYIQGNKNAASGTTVQTSYTNAQTAGNTNLVAVLTATATQPTVADTKLNAYTLVSSGNFAAQGIYLWLFAATNIAVAGANANTVTATTTVSNAYNGITVLEYFGVSSSLDVASTVGNGFGTVWTAPQITTTNHNDLVLAVGLGSSGGTVAAGTDSLGGTYTMRQTPGGSSLAPSCEDQIVNVTGTFFGTMTGSSQQQWCVLLTALKAATPPGQVTPVIGGSILVTGAATPVGPVIANQSGSILVTGATKIGQPVSATGGQILVTGSVTPSTTVLSESITASWGISAQSVTPVLPTLFEVISGSWGLTTATTPNTSTPLPISISALWGIKTATVTPTIPTLSESAVGNWTVRGAATPTIPILFVQIFGNWSIGQTITPTFFPPFVISGSIGVSSNTSAFSGIPIAYTITASWGLTGGATPILFSYTATGSWGVTGGVQVGGSLALSLKGVSGSLIGPFDFWGGGFC